jgi:hypothetical protein
VRAYLSANQRGTVVWLKVLQLIPLCLHLDHSYLFPFLDKKTTPKKTTPSKKEEASDGKKSPKSAGKKKADGAEVKTPQQPRKGNRALDSSVLNDSQGEIPGTPQVKNNFQRKYTGIYL